MKHLMPILILLLLVSCSKKIDGTLTVTEEMGFQKKSFWGNKKSLSIPVGEYDSTITLYKKDKVKFKIRNIDGEDRKIKFLIPDDVEFPRYSGELYLDSEISGQPFDLHAKVSSDRTESDEFNRRENCTYTVYKTECRQECHTENGQNVCRQVCRRRSISVHGSRSVSFYYTYIDTLFLIDFLEERTRTKQGQFKAQNHESSKHYTYMGSCF